MRIVGVAAGVGEGLPLAALDAGVGDAIGATDEVGVGDGAGVTPATSKQAAPKIAARMQARSRLPFDGSRAPAETFIEPYGAYVLDEHRQISTSKTPKWTGAT